MKTKLIIIISAVVIVIFIILSFIRGSNPEVPEQTVNMITPSVGAAEKTDAVVAAENLDFPSAVAFLPGGDMLVAERIGRVRFIEKNGTLQYNPVAVLKQVKQVANGGLLGIAVDPVYVVNNYIYIYYTYYEKRNSTLSRLSRMKLFNSQLTEEKILIDEIPSSLNNNGGRIKFGPDGYLYVATGDTENPSQAQDLNSLAGKILRITKEGKPAPGNPFNNLIYTYGHHNPQGLTWDRWDSWAKLWQTDSGISNPAGFDEINIIENGKNYGWPFIQGDETGGDTVKPIFNSGVSGSWDPAGAAFAVSSLFFGGQNSQVLYEAVINDGEVINLKEHFKGRYGGIKDVVLGPDNLLYFTTDSKILKVNPARIID